MHLPLDFVVEKMPPVYGSRETCLLAHGRLVVEPDESKDYNEAVPLGDSLRARPKILNFFPQSFFVHYTLMIHDGRINNDGYY